MGVAMAIKSAAAVFLALFLLSPLTNACSTCVPKERTPSSPTKDLPANPFCPTNVLKWGACVDLLGGLVNLVEGAPLKTKCCALLEGLADLEVAACLCTAVKANVLGISVDWPIALSLGVNTCGKKIPAEYKCV